MRPRLGFLLTLVISPLALADDLRTVAERSDYRATARHDDVMRLCRRLAERSKLVRLAELGRSVEGRPIPLLVVADPPVATPEEARRSGKLVVLLVGNIHAGEVSGKEALPMLVRDLIETEGHPLLKDLVLAVVPDFNPDGNERVAKDNRPGQVGPEEGMGIRANAQGLDLNRDFIKLDSPEARALVAFLNTWDPHAVIDTHDTNGSHHRYTITYQGPQNPGGDRPVLEYVRNTMLPAIDAAFERETGYKAFFYGNFDADHAKWETFPASPRFLTNYVGLRGRIAVLSEAYAYAPYKDRVLATRDFVRACLEYLAARKDEVRRRLEEARDRDQRATAAVVRSRLRALPDPVTVHGFVEERRDGKVVATAEPKDYEGVKHVQDFAPAVEVRRPAGYLMPEENMHVVETLRSHGIEVDRTVDDHPLSIEAAKVERLERSGRQYEGRRLVTLEAAASRKEGRRLQPPMIFVRARQPRGLGALAAYLLEAASDDGLAVWDAFGEGLVAGEDFPVLRTVQVPTTDRAVQEAARAKKKLTFEELERGGGMRLMGGGGAPPRWLDGEHLLQVQGGRLQKIDAASGQAEPFLDPDRLAEALETIPSIGADAARRLVRRPNPTLDPQKKAALFEHENDLYYATLDGAAALRLTSTPAREETPTFSPDGRFVAFVRENDLYVVAVKTGTERALTTGGTERVRHGKADWVYYEEIFNRNWKAYWWAPDSKSIALLEVDDRHVGTHAVLNDLGARRVVEETPYPRAGDANPRVRLGVVAVGGGPVQWAEAADYSPDSTLITGVGFWPDGRAAWAYVQDRAQTWLDLVRVPVGGGEPKRVLRERTKAWVFNESVGDPSFLADGSFLLRSERDGWNHLYHFAADGTLKRQVTRGEWEVRAVHRVDEEGGWVYFSGTRDSPIAQNLYRVKLDGGEPERLTQEPGSHSVAFSPDGKSYVDTWSSHVEPPRSAVFRAGGKRIRALDRGANRLADDYRLGRRELVQIPTKDGATLDGELIYPPDFDDSKRYPAWFTTYGGPHFPSVTDSWSGGHPWEQALASEGFVIFRCDPRSASGKGAVSAWTAYKKLGVQELADIQEAIGWLKQKPYVDGSRIGMSGHSYGGFITAYAMTHSDLFAAGIAGAPVTDWRDYDSIYTERYMGLPQDNPEGYDAASVVAAAGKLHGRLLILHGAIDDNVSLRNTMRLVHALQGANKDFELMIYPSARHGIFGSHYNHLQVDFIRRTLLTPKPDREAAGAP